MSERRENVRKMPFMHGYSCNYLTIKLQTSAWLACKFFVNNYFLVRPLSDVRNTPVSFGKILADGNIAVSVCSHILKFNKSECVHTMPQKRGLRPKPVPGRGCPSLKLRLSSRNKYPFEVLMNKEKKVPWFSKRKVSRFLILSRCPCVLSRIEIFYFFWQKTVASLFIC